MYKDTIIRIITSEKIFFFFHSQFDNTDSFLHQLKSGDEIIAAGHPLNNGGYWLHWAILDDNNELAPENKYDEGQSLLKYLACSTLASLVSFLMIIDGIESIFIAVLFLFTLIMNILFVKELIISAISPLNESVIIYQKEKGIVDKPFFNKKVYNLIKRHRPKIFSIVNGSSFKKQNSNFSIDDYELINKKAENLGLNVKLFDIKEIKIKSNMAVSHLRINNNRKRIQTPNNYYLISDGCNEFYCKTHNSSLAKEVLTKIQHPFFVALKDKVEVISDVDNHQVIGLYNHTDESAYLFKPSNHIDYNEMTPKVALVSSIIFFLIIFISTSMVSLYFRADFFMVTVLFFASMVIPIMIYSLYLIQKKKYFKSTQLDRFLIVKNYLQYCLGLNHNKSCVNVVLNTEHPTGFNTIVLNDDREDKK
nr:hypothetical protein [Providencia sneebia]